MCVCMSVSWIIINDVLKRNIFPLLFVIFGPVFLDPCIFVFAITMRLMASNVPRANFTILHEIRYRH